MCVCWGGGVTTLVNLEWKCTTQPPTPTHIINDLSLLGLFIYTRNQHVWNCSWMMIPAERYEGWRCLADIPWTTIAFDSYSLSPSVRLDRWILAGCCERERERVRNTRRNTHTHARLMNFGYNITMPLWTEFKCVWIWWTSLASLTYLASSLLHSYIYFSTAELRWGQRWSEKLISLLSLIKIHHMKQ